ncbi:MAG: hypothetical protein AAGI52_02075 [Bacteroidota bacterium]
MDEDRIARALERAAEVEATVTPPPTDEEVFQRMRDRVVDQAVVYGQR